MKTLSGLIAGLALMVISQPALADTLYVQGFVNAPTRPDSNPGVYGYDNGGFFGPAFANLGGDPFTITWTGTDCNCYGGPIMNAPNVISGATLTINGITVDLAAFNNIWQSEWLDAADGGNTFIQMQTIFLSQSFPPWSQILPSSQYSMTTEFHLFNGVLSGQGVFYLLDTNHSFQTSAFLTMGVGLGVPGPLVGAGLPGLSVAIIVGLLGWWRRRRQLASFR